MDAKLNGEEFSIIQQTTDLPNNSVITDTHLGRLAAQARRANALLIEPALEVVYVC